MALQSKVLITQLRSLFLPMNQVIRKQKFSNLTKLNAETARKSLKEKVKEKHAKMKGGKMKSSSKCISNGSSKNHEICSYDNKNCADFEATTYDHSHEIELTSEESSEEECSLLLQNRHGPIINSLLHKTYYILNESKDERQEKNQSICKARSNLTKMEKKSQDGNAMGSLSAMSPVIPFEINKDDAKLQTLQLQKDSYQHITTSRLLNGKMSKKYQSPTDDQVNFLKTKYPNYKSLVAEVSGHLIEGGVLPSTQPTLTSHLNGRYWKAKLHLLWPLKTSDTGTHPVKELAVDRALLLCCHKLQDLGLIYKSTKEGQWCSVTPDMVVEWLDLISYYGARTVGCSRGRGFKILLEQIKETTTQSADRELEMAHQLIGDQGVTGKGELLCSGGQVHTDPQSDRRWRCTVHVGWPFPFTVQEEAVSLPVAQRLGCLAVANKLKMKKLLKHTNEHLSVMRLEYCVIQETLQQWEKYSLEQYIKQGQMSTKFEPDAEIFCDASVKGFGAFLIRKEASKVSWISESWVNHQEVRQRLLIDNSNHLISTLAEMFSVVTAVFTWKTKLRHSRLLIFSDNMTVISLLNTLSSMPMSRDMCHSQYDHLVHLYQFACSQHSITAHCVWLERNQNHLADCLSRQDINRFRNAVPNAANFQTKAKMLRIRRQRS